MKIGLFGLGNMGLPMAVNLVKAKYHVKGHDIATQAMDSFASQGGTKALGISDAAKDVDVIISMLPSGKIAKELYLSQEGIMAFAGPQTLLIDCSTIAASDATEIASKARQKGFAMIDAPVSGGVAGAKAATLTFIVGGQSKDLERARPILSAMGKNVLHAGKNGAGQVAKICNNMLLAIHMIGSCEAINLGIKHGLSPQVVSQIMQQSSGDNWTLQKYNPCPNVMEGVPSSRNYEGGFSAALMLKDLGLAIDAAEATKAKTPLGQLAKKLYKEHHQNHGDKDFSSIFTHIE